MAIGPKDWRPRIDRPPIQFVRFNPKALESGIEQHVIEGVPVRIYGPAKTIVDLFRYRRNVGLNAAIEGMRAALRGRKTTADEIARYAHDAGVWNALRPYLEALTTDA